jgi:RNA polymerase sigma-70 factor (ECF subfamily)
MASEVIDNTDLLRQAQGGDEQALRKLFEPHRERLRKMVRLRLDRRLREQFSSSAVLEDVAREAGRRIQEYSSGSTLPFFLWLRLLAGQRIQELHRQYLGEQAWAGGAEVSLYRGALPEANSMSLAAQLLGHMTAATQAAARADMQIRLQDAINSMDPVDREVLTLCHFEELSNAEAAAVLGLDRSVATQHYVRALKRLKEILSSIPGFFKTPKV